MFPAQIIATGVLDKKYHKWFGTLSGQLQKDNIQELLDSRNHMTQKNRPGTGRFYFGSLYWS